MMACSTIELHARLADNDFKGVDVTNLNRYVLFGSDSVGKLKPNAACDLLRQEHLHLTPWNNSVEKLEPIGDRVLSAVDTNRAREGIQFRYPARIISASTSDLRAEVHRCGAPGKGACLRCYNPPEILPTDEELVLQLKKASGEEFAKICVGAGVSVETAKTWISTKRCGDEGERLLTFLREQDQGGGVFAVGFTSVLAGVLLATEFIKDCIGYKEPLNNSTNHAVFQFFEVLSGANESSFVAADVKCPACKSDRPGLPIWQGRFSALEPNR
jgi:hypothetical protein